jgi:CDP-glucose 4,6-dehydratase
MIGTWGSGSIASTAQNGAPHEASRLLLNCDKARQELGWRPQWDFDRAVYETVRWYRKWNEGSDALDLSIGQIQTHTRDWENAKIGKSQEIARS